MGRLNRPYPVGVPKKAKTPRPPNVQAPKRRDSKPARASGFATLRPYWPWIATGVAAVAILVVVMVATSGGGGSGVSDTSVRKAMATAGCKYRSVKPFP